MPAMPAYSYGSLQRFFFLPCHTRYSRTSISLYSYRLLVVYHKLQTAEQYSHQASLSAPCRNAGSNLPRGRDRWVRCVAPAGRVR
jgi:hypothetical protein